MRKIFALLLTFFVAASSWAASIKVLSGDLSVFNDNSITASLIFDYSNLEIEGTPYKKWLKDKGSDYVRDWPDQTKASEEYFIRCWNKDNDEGIQVSTTKGKPYVMVIDAREMDMGSGAASMIIGFGAGGAKLSGTMYIFKSGSNIPLLTVEIDGQTGRSAMTELARRVDLYGELAEDMVSTIKKTKQSRVTKSTKAVELACLSGVSATADVEEEISEPAPVKKVKATASQKATKAVKEVAVKDSEDPKIELLHNAKGQEIPRRRLPFLGDFDGLASLRNMGVFLDFSDAEILGRSEDGFIRYMKTSAGRKDLDRDFDKTWEEDLKPNLEDLFISEVNAELKDEDIRLRLSSTIETEYVLKLEVLEIDDDGNNKINFLVVDMSNGEVKAQITCQSDGGRVGRLVGLLNQGFESAAKNFAKLFIENID